MGGGRYRATIFYPSTIAANAGTVQNVRLWDEGPLRQSYNQIRSFRLHCDFLRLLVRSLEETVRQLEALLERLRRQRLP